METSLYVLKKKNYLQTNALPFEILALILEKAARTRRFSFEELIGYDIIPLSHVNRHWRTVALGTAHLWSQVDIIPSLGSISLAALFLDRSGQHSINVHVLNGTIETFVQIVLPHISRCREISAFVASDTFWSNFADIIRDVATPQLRYLSVNNTTDAHRGASYSPSFVMRAPRPPAPFILSGSATDIPYTFKALTRFEIDAGPRRNTIRDYIGLHNVLNGLPNLRDLIFHETVFSVEFVDRTMMKQSPILHLPALRNLSYVSVQGASDVMHLLTKLDAPMLTDVEIRSKWSTAAWDITSTAFPSVRRAILQMLVPQPQVLNAPWTWRHFNHLFPQLVNLTLPYDNLYPFISYSLSEPTLLPWAHLETLTIADSKADAQSPYISDAESVSLWIAERIEQSVPIREVKWLPRGTKYSDSVSL